MTTTIGGVPWQDYRPWPDGPTWREINEQAFAPASREHGYCMCYHPFADVIDFDGMTCAWCGQSTTEASESAAAKATRTAALLAAFPALATR